MTNELIQEHNAKTNEIIVRELTNKEQAERNAAKTAFEEAKTAAVAAATELRALKISAYQKQGLTAEEIEAILPTPVEAI